MSHANRLCLAQDYLAGVDQYRIRRVYHRGGIEASRAYLNLTTGKQSRGEERSAREELERYCRRDTEAMMPIVEVLEKLACP